MILSIGPVDIDGRTIELELHEVALRYQHSTSTLTRPTDIGKGGMKGRLVVACEFRVCVSARVFFSRPLLTRLIIPPSTLANRTVGDLWSGVVDGNIHGSSAVDSGRPSVICDYLG
jgi:hypothetical protein